MMGGEHFLPPAPRVNRSLADSLEGTLGALSLFATGRDALFAMLRALPQRTVHLPDLMCESVHRACVAAGKEVRLYTVGMDLREGGVADLAPLQSDVVLVMHYFGLPNTALARRCQDAGAFVISDITHLLFNEEALRVVARHSDQVFGTLRKSAPLPDGALVAGIRQTAPVATDAVREQFVALRSAALLSRGYSATEDFADDENFAWLKKAEELLDTSPAAAHACSYLGRQLLNTVDVAAAGRRIRDNMEVLAGILEGACRNPCLPSLPSPYFLCLFADRGERDRVRTALARERHFLPVHWDTSWSPRPSTLSAIGLSIPCDARYGAAEMRTVAEMILEGVEG